MITKIGKRMLLTVAVVLLSGCMGVAVNAAETNNTLVNLELADADVRTAIMALFKSAGKQFVIDQDVQGVIPMVSFKNQQFDTALKNLVKSAGLVYSLDGDIYTIRKKIAAINQTPTTAMPDVSIVETTSAPETIIEKVPLSNTGASELLAMMGSGSAGSGGMGGMGMGGGMGGMGGGMGGGMSSMGGGGMGGMGGGGMSSMGGGGMSSMGGGGMSGGRGGGGGGYGRSF